MLGVSCSFRIFFLHITTNAKENPSSCSNSSHYYNITNSSTLLKK